MNFLRETLEAIKDSGHKPQNITFIGSVVSGHSCTWEEFKSLADFDYDPGFGWAEIAQDLVVLFDDGDHLWREEYDGSEWWKFQAQLSPPAARQPITTLWTGGSSGWCSLADLHKEKK